jgi:aryl-phospho-beta-D-glucosidase BglC (GH1 family)
VYRGPWDGVRRELDVARKWGVGVLIDFHAVYGRANGKAHSGTNSGHARLWGE